MPPHIATGANSAKFVIGRIGHCAFDGSGAAGIGRLPQNTEESLRLGQSTFHDNSKKAEPRSMQRSPESPLPLCWLSKRRVLPRQGVCRCPKATDITIPVLPKVYLTKS
jgi:hypothetical protein